MSKSTPLTLKSFLDGSYPNKLDMNKLNEHAVKTIKSRLAMAQKLVKENPSVFVNLSKDIERNDYILEVLTIMSVLDHLK